MDFSDTYYSYIYILMYSIPAQFCNPQHQHLEQPHSRNTVDDETTGRNERDREKKGGKEGRWEGEERERAREVRFSVWGEQRRGSESGSGCGRE